MIEEEVITPLVNTAVLAYPVIFLCGCGSQDLVIEVYVIVGDMIVQLFVGVPNECR